MKVLLDTNVLASAAATRGLCADVLREVLSNHELILCSQILSELRRALRDKFAVPDELIEDFLWLLRQDTVYTEPGELPKLNLNDKDDLGILAAALNGGAQIMVTGDKELQELGQFQDVTIMSPRKFWDGLNSSATPP